MLFRIGFHRTNYGALDASDACTDDKSKMVLFVQIGGEISTGQSKEHHIFLLWTPSWISVPSLNFFTNNMKELSMTSPKWFYLWIKPWWKLWKFWHLISFVVILDALMWFVFSIDVLRIWRQVSVYFTLVFLWCKLLLLLLLLLSLFFFALLFFFFLYYY
jgi:hypothetical protein